MRIIFILLLSASCIGQTVSGTAGSGSGTTQGPASSTNNDILTANGTINRVQDPGGCTLTATALQCTTQTIGVSANASTSWIGFTSERFYSAGTRDLRLQQSGVDKFEWTNGPYTLDQTTGVLSWTIAAPDTGISRDAAGVVDVGNGTAQDISGKVKAAQFIAGTGHLVTESAGPTNVASSGSLWEDSTSHEWQSSTAGSSTPGLIARVQPGVIHQTAQTAAITTATLCAASAGACNVAGTYTVEWAFWEEGTACGTPGAGGVTFVLTWTDSNGTAHSAISLPMDDASSLVATTGTFHFQTSNAVAWASGNFNISSNGSIIQYATGYTACGVGTGTYGLDIAVTRKR